MYLLVQTTAQQLGLNQPQTLSANPCFVRMQTDGRYEQGQSHGCFISCGLQITLHASALDIFGINYGKLKSKDIERWFSILVRTARINPLRKVCWCHIEKIDQYDNRHENIVKI